jgi:hypothetical protein
VDGSGVSDPPILEVGELEEVVVRLLLLSDSILGEPLIFCSSTGTVEELQRIQIQVTEYRSILR